MAVPDTDTFTLLDVRAEMGAIPGNTLVDFFNQAFDSRFDSRYEGGKDRLLNFRNYGEQIEYPMVPEVIPMGDEKMPKFTLHMRLTDSLSTPPPAGQIDSVSIFRDNVLYEEVAFAALVVYNNNTWTYSVAGVSYGSTSVWQVQSKNALGTSAKSAGVSIQIGRQLILLTKLNSASCGSTSGDAQPFYRSGAEGDIAVGDFIYGEEYHSGPIINLGQYWLSEKPALIEINSSGVVGSVADCS